VLRDPAVPGARCGERIAHPASALGYGSLTPSLSRTSPVPLLDLAGL
jgi:hypothetical protein